MTDKTRWLGLGPWHEDNESELIDWTAQPQYKGLVKGDYYHAELRYSGRWGDPGHKGFQFGNRCRIIEFLLFHKHVYLLSSSPFRTVSTVHSAMPSPMRSVILSPGRTPDTLFSTAPALSRASTQPFLTMERGSDACMRPSSRERRLSSSDIRSEKAILILCTRLCRALSSR